MPHAHTRQKHTNNRYFPPNQTKKPQHVSLNNTVVTAIQGLISAADEQLLKIDRIKQSAANNLSKVRTLYLHFLLAIFFLLFFLLMPQ